MPDFIDELDHKVVSLWLALLTSLGLNGINWQKSEEAKSMIIEAQEHSITVDEFKRVAEIERRAIESQQTQIVALTQLMQTMSTKGPDRVIERLNEMDSRGRVEAAKEELIRKQHDRLEQMMESLHRQAVLACRKEHG